MHRLLVLLALVATLRAAPAFAAAAEAPLDPHALIGRVLAAYGGRTALAKVHAYRLEGETFSAMRHTSAPIVRVFARPDRFKTLIDYPHAPEARLVDSDRGWRTEQGSALEPVTGAMFDAMLLQAARADMPWILAERESSAVSIDPIFKAGVAYAGLEITLAPGLLLRAYVEPGTHFVTVSQGELARGPMHTHFETYYSDFRAVDGLHFAFHEDNWASGVQTGVTTVKRVILDPKLAPDEFRPPGAAPAPAPKHD